MMDRTAEEATRQQRDDDGQDSFEKKTRAGHRTKSRTEAGTEPGKKAEIVTCRVRKNSASGGQRKVITRLPRTSAGRGAYGGTVLLLYTWARLPAV